MKATVREFLTQIIDYAGLFPPAKLSMDDAVNRYFQARAQSPHRWMLGRFVCPASRLPELLRLARSSPHAALLSLTVLGQQSSHARAFAGQIEADMGAIAEFRRAWGDDTVIDMYEVALPADAARDWFPSALEDLARHLPSDGFRVFLELPRSPGWRSDVEALVYEIHLLNDGFDRPSPPIGLKLRCGGLTADAFPSDDDVAFFIHRCELPWKATAGLHHPRRFSDQAIGVWHHGFLNVFGAGLLARANPLREADIASILADRDAEHFRFDDKGFAWKDWTCPLDQIAPARCSATTFGSCSFDEPCADLLAMGLLDEGA